MVQKEEQVTQWRQYSISFVDPVLISVSIYLVSCDGTCSRTESLTIQSQGERKNLAGSGRQGSLFSLALYFHVICFAMSFHSYRRKLFFTLVNNCSNLSQRIRDKSSQKIVLSPNLKSPKPQTNNIQALWGIHLGQIIWFPW